MTTEAEKEQAGAAEEGGRGASATGGRPLRPLEHAIPTADESSGGRRGRARETAADRARRALVGLKVGPSRSFVLAVIGSASLFVAAIVIGYLTK